MVQQLQQDPVHLHALNRRGTRHRLDLRSGAAEKPVRAGAMSGGLWEVGTGERGGDHVEEEQPTLLAAAGNRVVD